ncbi:Nif11-like leader peptide family natural product precursor [Pseudodesulfovibrio methanolicus]|uniref:Nif11-like leader peptide family natural product n=1 Tax=Pseudodesulfovibrio methanolicus TaxID=3126690 RepID=A0ABZ2IX60_9BACT
MSRDELSRLMGDALADPELIREAMTLKDRPALEAFVRERGYALSPDEMDEIWELARKVLGGGAGAVDAARWRLTTVGNEPLAPLD